MGTRRQGNVASTSVQRHRRWCDVALTSPRCTDVDATLYRRWSDVAITSCACREHAPMTVGPYHHPLHLIMCVSTTSLVQLNLRIAFEHASKGFRCSLTFHNHSVSEQQIHWTATHTHTPADTSFLYIVIYRLVSRRGGGGGGGEGVWGGGNFLYMA